MPLKEVANEYPLPAHGLRNRLLTGVLPVLTGMIVIILVINFIYQMENGKAVAAQTLSLVADSYENDIQQWLARRQNEAALTADNPLIRQSTVEILKNGPEAAPARDTVTRFLQVMLQEIPVYDEIYCLDPAGRILFSTNQARVGLTRPVDNLLKQPLEHGGVYFQDAYFAYSTKVPCVAYSAAVSDPDGKRLAVLVFRVKTSEFLDSIARGQARLGKTGEVVLLKRDRTVINELRNKPGSSLSFRSSSEPAILAAKGEEGVKETTDYDNRPVMAAYRSIPFAGWGLVVKQDMNEIMLPVWRSTMLITLPGLTGLLLLVLLVTFIIGRAVAPLQTLTGAAAALSRGDFSRRIDVALHKDEIGVLGRTFNDMAAGLQAQFGAQERLQQLLEVLVSTIQTGPLLYTALESIARSHGFAVGAVYLQKEETKTLKLMAVYSPSSRLLLADELPAGEGPGGQALSSRRPVVLDDVPADTKYTVRTISGELLPSYIYHLPLVFGERVLGLLVLGGVQQPAADCLEQLQSMATLLAVAVNNALMFERVQNMSEELSAQNEELQAQAEELQAQAEELQTQGRELAEKNQQLEQATRMKSAFLARMSHELRTPLNAVIGFSEILLEGLFGELNAKQKEYLKDILSSGRHLLSLINDILDLSKIEAGRVELALRPVDPMEVMHEALILTWPEAVRKKLQIDLQFSSGQYKVMADSEKLKQIFVNLLSNAVKFSPPQGRINATAAGDGKELTLSVTDQGIGIAPEMHQVIFDEFKQGEYRPNTPVKGTGLGLAISKKLVEMHGGRIWVDSRPGCGATFSFTLRLAAEHAAPAGRTGAADQAAAAVEAEEPVLLVEDDPSACRLLEAYLGEEGYRVETAGTGEEALEKADRLHPWVIILDIILPDRDGWEVLAELKSAPGTRDIPVVIVSALNEAGRGISLGALDYFVKPVDKDLLLARLRSLKGLPEGNPSVLVVDDDPKIVEYLAAVLESSGYRVFRAGGGRQAVDLVLRQAPDVMILDLVMPEMTGFDVLEELSTHPEAAKTRVFILTAKDLTAAEKDRLNRRVITIARKGELSKGQFLKRLEQVRKMTMRKGTNACDHPDH
ncbi:response regulator [Desulfotomaculum copahuensis]|uniref:Stage 0 sporulation protein A homolog n=1 Tax=Desulfotomaculum copahuensis TaxID=1838280 RepID=A0A1B7LGJ9_9FIRM|nr:response regulator [Desulfotomaculum copahuensis]OAT85178.1 hypothetical protein A6M21_06405 [Desulfotomaculum copahuensis]